ncbi:hypothetical protein AAG906_031264 [Vitis piasezkii]
MNLTCYSRANPLMNPLSSIRQAYSSVSQEEKHLCYGVATTSLDNLEGRNKSIEHRKDGTD